VCRDARDSDALLLTSLHPVLDRMCVAQCQDGAPITALLVDAIPPPTRPPTLDALLSPTQRAPQVPGTPVGSDSSSAGGPEQSTAAEGDRMLFVTHGTTLQV